MRKQRYLSGACLAGLILACTAAPAWAAEEEADEAEIASEAIGTFNGFRLQAAAESIRSARLTADFTTPVEITRRDRLNGTLTGPSPDLIVRDDIGIAGAVDVNNTLPSVVHMFIHNNSTNSTNINCTGTLINPRTVLTAAHCVNDESSEAYGLAGQAPLTMWVSTGFDSRPRLLATENDPSVGYSGGGAARSTDVIIHPSSNQDEGGLTFPYADVALIALDQPITDVPFMPLLLSPLTQLTHVIVAGYGTNGTGDTGGTDAGNIFLRRIGENMLGMIGSEADFLDGVFPGFSNSAAEDGFTTQTLYWFDFDNPNRTAEQKAGCTFPGRTIICDDVAAERAVDWFPDDALPREAGTAPGDSGSPLIVDQLYGFPVIAGVLSGGYDLFRSNFGYTDASFYNPLFPFFEFITENTPYKYVSARGGSGRWSDPKYWTQNLDPGFFIDNGKGKLVNGIPTGSETGVYDTGSKLGFVLTDDVSNNSTAPSPFLPAPGTPNFGGNLPESSRLLGPGSSGFVPNNTDGVVGTSFASPAQYFDVLLHRHGATTVDINVLIDKLTVDNTLARLILPRGITLTSLIGFEQFRGHTSVDGTLNAGLATLFGGRLNGNGTIKTDAFFNVAGMIYPRTTNSIGTLTINGDYVQSSGGALVIDISAVRVNNASDVLRVTGDAILDGALLLNPINRELPRFGATFTVLNAATIDGNFGTTTLITDSVLLLATSRVESNKVVVEISARPIASVLPSDSGLASVGSALDTLRFSGHYSAFEHLFGVIDSAGYQAFGQTLASLTPTSGFAQASTANGFSQRFTGQIAQRTLSLRGAAPAAAGFSAAGNATFAQAGTAPGEPGKLGFFGSVSGAFLDMAQRDHSSGGNAFEDAAFQQAGELTIGADYRVSDGVAVGVAMTNIRNSTQSVAGFRPHEDESVSAAAYAAATFGKGFADGYVGYASQSFGMERASQGDFTGKFRSALGSSSGKQTFAGLRVGYAMEPARGLTVGPVASLDYVRSDLGGYSEYGAGAFGLNVEERSLVSVGAKLGAMAALDGNVSKAVKVTAFGSVAYARELADTQDVITASFIGAENVPFTIANRLDPQWVSVNAGAELHLSDRVSTRMSVTSDLGRGVLTNNQANLSLSWKF